MYIITYKEFDERETSWSERGRTFYEADYAQDFLKYMLEVEHYGIVRDIKLWDAKEIPYKSNIKVEFEIDWEG